MGEMGKQNSKAWREALKTRKEAEQDAAARMEIAHIAEKLGGLRELEEKVEEMNKNNDGR